MANRAIRIWYDFLKSDSRLRDNFKPTVPVLNSLKLPKCLKNQRTGNDDLATVTPRVLTDETKLVFEFCNLIVDTYKDRYGITFDDFSKD